MLQRHDSDAFSQKEGDGFPHELNNSLCFPNPQDNQNTFTVPQPMTVAMQNTEHETKPDGDAQLQNLKNMSAQNTQSLAMGSNSQQSATEGQNITRKLDLG